MQFIAANGIALDAFQVKLAVFTVVLDIVGFFGMDEFFQQIHDGHSPRTNGYIEEKANNILVIRFPNGESC